MRVHPVLSRHVLYSIVSASYARIISSVLFPFVLSLQNSGIKNRPREQTILWPFFLDTRFSQFVSVRLKKTPHRQYFKEPKVIVTKSNLTQNNVFL